MLPNFQNGGGKGSAGGQKRPHSANKATKPTKGNHVYNTVPTIITEENMGERPFSNLTREELEVTLRVTKTKLKNEQTLVTTLRSENQRYEAELLKQSKRLEKFLDQSSTAGTGNGKMVPSGEQRRELEKSLLVRQLKTQVMMLRSTVAEREMEIETIRKSAKNSKLIELSNEKEEYFIETMRLKQVVKELRETLQHERKQFRALEMKKASAGEDIRREVTKLTSGYQNILKGISAQSGQMVSVLQGGASGRPTSAQFPSRVNATTPIARRPQSATKTRLGQGLILGQDRQGQGYREKDYRGGGDHDNNLDELDFFTGEMDTDAEQLNLNLKGGTGDASPSPGKKDRGNVNFIEPEGSRGGRGLTQGAQLKSTGALLESTDKAFGSSGNYQSMNTLLSPEELARGEYVEVFISKIVASNVVRKTKGEDLMMQLAFNMSSRENEALWKFTSIYKWSSKAQQVYTLGRSTVMKDGQYVEEQNPEMKWVCSYRDLQMGTFTCTAQDKALPAFDDDNKPVKSFLGDAQTALVPLPPFIRGNEDIAMPLELDIELKITDEGNRFCIVAVTLEVGPASPESYEQQRQTKTQAAAAAVAISNAAAKANLPPMPYKPGNKVEANYKGQGSYYRATVKSVNKEDRTCALRYDDGDEEKSVPLDRIRALPGAVAPVKSPVKSPLKSSANSAVDNNNTKGGSDVAANASPQPNKVVPVSTAASASNVSIPTTTTTPSSSGGGGGSKYSVGQKVDALFDRGEEWWPATVKGLSTKIPGTYNLLYDDGDVEDDVSITRMRPAPGTAQGSGLASGGDNNKGQSSFDNYLDGLSLEEDEGQGLASGPAVYGNINSISTPIDNGASPHSHNNHNNNSHSHPAQGSPMKSKNTPSAQHTPSPVKSKGPGGHVTSSVEGDSSYMEDFDP